MSIDDGRWGSSLGIQLGIVIAGFAGGVVSVLFARNMSRGQAVGSILASLMAATYLTPAVVLKLGIAAPPYQYCTAFVVGLCTMTIIPALKVGVNRFVVKRVDQASDSNSKTGD